MDIDVSVTDDHGDDEDVDVAVSVADDKLTISLGWSPIIYSDNVIVARYQTLETLISYYGLFLSTLAAHNMRTIARCWSIL